MKAESDAKFAETQAETARRLQSGLHARKADRHLREAHEELNRQRARVAALDLRAAVRAREEA